MNEFQIEKLLQLTEENNTLLKKMRKNQLIQNYIRIGYVVILILSVYSGYLFLKPVYQSIFGIYDTINQTTPLGTEISKEGIAQILQLLQ